MPSRVGTVKAAHLPSLFVWISGLVAVALSLRYAPLDGYGLLWSLDSQAQTYWATGWGGQFLLVDPSNDLIIVTRNDTGRRLSAVLWLSVLGNSTQGRMHEVMTIRDMVLNSSG